MEILLLMFLLQAKHWYADFFIQTYDQTVKKGVYGDPVGLSHSLDHMLWTVIALTIFNFFHPLAPVEILAISILEGIAHYHIDWVKVKYGIKDMYKPRFWREFGADQMAHHICYLFIIWYIMVRSS